MKTEAEPVVEGVKPVQGERLKHVRCCKPAVPKGLCGQGEAVTDPSGMVRIPDATCCVVCFEMLNTHLDVCPQDSEYR